MLFLYHDNHVVSLLLIYRFGASGAIARWAARNLLMRIFSA